MIVLAVIYITFLSFLGEAKRETKKIIQIKKDRINDSYHLMRGQIIFSIFKFLFIDKQEKNLLQKSNTKQAKKN